MEERTVQRGSFVLVDPKWSPRPLLDERRSRDVDPETIMPTEDENGVVVYLDAPIQMCKDYVSRDPARFRLYRTPPQTCPVKTHTGRIEYIKFYPWYYERFVRAVEAKEGAATDLQTVTEWHENRGPAEGGHPWEYGPIVRGSGNADAGQTPLTPPQPSPPKNPYAAALAEMKVAGEIIGTETVRDMEKEFRAEIKKPSGAFSKDEAFAFIDRLRAAVTNAENEAERDKG